MLFGLFLTIAAVEASFAFPPDHPTGQHQWDGLKVKWSRHPFAEDSFNSMPMTTSEAISQGFTIVSHCDVNANWRGARYIKDGDYALVLLFDVNGYIAGIQTTIPSDQPNGYPTTNIQPPFVRDGDHFVLSAYFVDPSIICTTGRSSTDFNNQGTGTNLYIQNGTNAECDSIMIPRQETDISGTNWKKGKCFHTMGLHYWYDIRVDMSCDDFFPVFLMYTSGELRGFGWATGTNLSSRRWEHPHPAAIGYFMEPVPDCLATQGTMSTMHVFLNRCIICNLCSPHPPTTI